MSGSRIRDLGGQDPYAILGLDRTADNNAIVRAHRERIRDAHPDLPTGDAETAKLLHLAREVLLDPQQRAEYDRLSTPGIPNARQGSAWDDDDVVEGAIPSTWDDDDVMEGVLIPPSPEPPPRPQWTPPPTPPRIDNNMAMSVIALVLFLPLGLPAVLNAAKVAPAVAVGNYAAAIRASRNSRTLSRLALVIGLLGFAACCLGCLASSWMGSGLSVSA